MKNMTRSLAATLFFFTLASPLQAAGFPDSFRAWVLGEENRPAPKSEALVLDQASEGCIQCHNGRDSGHIVVKSAQSPMQFTASGRQSNHPIAMDYDRYVMEQPGSYRPRSQVDPNIRFAGGRVSCISCHLPREGTGGFVPGPDTSPGFLRVSHKTVSVDDCTSDKLAVGPRVTDLCLSCHII